MKSLLCAVYDSAARIFGAPFCAPTEQSAIRSFRQEVNSDKTKSQVAAAPGDFSLHICYAFDDATCEVSKLDEPIIVRAKDLIDVDD